MGNRLGLVGRMLGYADGGVSVLTCRERCQPGFIFLKELPLRRFFDQEVGPRLRSFEAERIFRKKSHQLEAISHTETGRGSRCSVR